MDRLKERAQDRLTTVKRMRAAMLFLVSIIVLVGLVLNFISTSYLVTSDLDGWRQFQVLLNGVSLLVDLVVLFLAWVIFDTLTRMEREAERLQAFMDNVYRRMP